MLKFEDFEIGSDNPNQYAVISKIGHTYSVLLPAVEVLDDGVVVELYASYSDFTDINDAIDLASDINDEIDEILTGSILADTIWFHEDDYDWI